MLSNLEPVLLMRRMLKLTEEMALPFEYGLDTQTLQVTFRHFFPVKVMILLDNLVLPESHL